MMEVEIDFTNEVLIKTDGIYEKVKEEMKDDVADQWCLVSKVIISSPETTSVMVLDFHYNGDICISDYKPPSKDVYYNVDIEALNAWIDIAGWNSPPVVPDYLVESDFQFWQHFHSVSFIKSKFLDKKSPNKTR